jgi:hypothetical protein
MTMTPTDGRRVWIAQCLCPQRHAILAAANEADDRSEAEELVTQLRTQVTRMIGSGTLNPWCGLCGTPRERWLYEVERTRFATMREAMPALRFSEREQAELRRASADG